MNNRFIMSDQILKKAIFIILEQFIPLLLSGGSAAADIQEYLLLNDCNTTTRMNLNLINSYLQEHSTHLEDFIFSRLSASSLIFLALVLRRRPVSDESLDKLALSIVIGFLAESRGTRVHDLVAQNTSSRIRLLSEAIGYEEDNNLCLTKLRLSSIPTHDDTGLRIIFATIPLFYPQ